MANKKPKIENLKPIKKGDLSKDELKKRQSNGGKKSAVAKKQNKAFREIIIERLKVLEQGGKTTKEVLIWKLIDKIQDEKTDIKDLLKALEFLRDSSGEKPTDKLETLTRNIVVGSQEDKDLLESI